MGPADDVTGAGPLDEVTGVDVAVEPGAVVEAPALFDDDDPDPLHPNAASRVRAAKALVVLIVPS
ncbi:MAG TPA: hypothetical protein VFF73_17105 [Planctomycetota bacterium]|nr:hypothetical protein [Planctomycetota bacterium]